MLKTALRRTYLAIGLMMPLLCVSCFDRHETITVDKDGTTTIVAEFSGKASAFPYPVALPSEPEWTILEDRRDTLASGEEEIRLKAQIIVPYGEFLPEMFAGPDTPYREVNLQFPAEVKLYREGNRTYYEFKRTYVGRRHRCYDVSESFLWDHELENRVLEAGIFEVSEEDRTGYLEQFAGAFAYKQWRVLWEALGRMFLSGDLSLDAKNNIESTAWQHLENTVTPVRLLGMLGNDEDSLAVRFGELEDEVRRAFTSIFSSELGPDQPELLQKFHRRLDMVNKASDVTGALDGHNFVVELNLPGVVVDASGYIDPDSPGKVEWHFDGKALHDGDLSLYAVSVVEN
ncbi:MAG: hypothetical protein JSW34_08770 [Candidatus Zixiibacteriota bacterium]|nr:MAG: hypothetical protein JSW34_08770 [candidate division Zixibacteria bacterium]